MATDDNLNLDEASIFFEIPTFTPTNLVGKTLKICRFTGTDYGKGFDESVTIIVGIDVNTGVIYVLDMLH